MSSDEFANPGVRHSFRRGAGASPLLQKNQFGQTVLSKTASAPPAEEAVEENVIADIDEDGIVVSFKPKKSIMDSDDSFFEGLEEVLKNSTRTVWGKGNEDAENSEEKNKSEVKVERPKSVEPSMLTEEDLEFERDNPMSEGTRAEIERLTQHFIATKEEFKQQSSSETPVRVRKEFKRVEASPAENIICCNNACRKPLPAHAKFCLECGEKQNTKPKFCLECGFKFTGSEKFCSECGKLR